MVISDDSIYAIARESKKLSNLIMDNSRFKRNLEIGVLIYATLFILIWTLVHTHAFYNTNIIKRSRNGLQREKATYYEVIGKMIII